MTTRREQQEQILASSKRQLNDIKKNRTQLVNTMRQGEHSTSVMETMISTSVELKKKIEEIHRANLEYERTMYEDN